MTIERQRSRIVAAMVLASLGQDCCLLVANVGHAIGQSFENFSKTFAFLFNDQARKYQILTGSEFTGQGELGNEDDGDD